MVLLYCTSTYATQMRWTLLQLPDQNCLGSSVASTLTMTCGSLQTKTLRTLYFMESNQETSGSTKSSSTQKETESTAMSVLRFTCPHAEHACYNMSISVPVRSMTCKRLSLQLCPSCVISMEGQVLENLESTLPRVSTDRWGLECSVLPTSSEGTTSPTRISEKHFDW